VRLLNQLSSFEYKVGLKENRKKRHGSTGSWLMAQQEYQSWFKDKCSSFLLLWGGGGFHSCSEVNACSYFCQLVAERAFLRKNSPSHLPM
jgi:hypothetical protein